MIYLLQDCYEDHEGKFHKVLKIGYSSKPFGESRKSSYDTHNFGYRLISEREGSQELEKYLHKRFTKYHISLEWFRYDQEIIDLFGSVSEDDISIFTSQEELNEYIRDYILHNLIPSVSKLSDLYLDSLLDELRKESREFPDLKYTEDLFRREIIGVFKFVSSRERDYFENLDFESLEVRNILSSCSLYFPQIDGRQRNEDDPFKNEITIFYKTQKNVVTKEEFDNLQEERKNGTFELLNLYQKGTEVQKALFIEKIKDGIVQRNYSNDFVSISEETNQPVYNYLVEISNERAWEVSQGDYQDNISVTKALEDQGFQIDSYQDKEDIILQDFLDNHFYRTGIFHEKMKMYCEFRDTYGGNQDIMRALDSKIKDPRYRMYYEYYGTPGCRAVSYKEADLYRGWKDITKEDDLRSIVYGKFKVGDRYPVSELKESVSKIYEDLGISKTPKATDLRRYFKLIKTRITLPDKTVVNGFRLDSL